MWSPHGIGVRREDGSAVGAGRWRRFQTMWGWRGKFSWSVRMVGRCWLLWSAPLSRRARPFQEGRAPFREGAPLLLTWMAGGSSPFRRFGDFLLFFHTAKSWWKLDPLAVIQILVVNFLFGLKMNEIPNKTFISDSHRPFLCNALRTSVSFQPS